MTKCKFCGSEPTVVSIGPSGTGLQKAIVVCSNYNCFARTKEFRSPYAKIIAMNEWNVGNYDIHRDDEGFIQRM